MRIKISSIAGVGGDGALYNLTNNQRILLSVRIRADGSIVLFGSNSQSKIIFDSATPVVTASQEGYLEVTATISGTTNLNIAASVWYNNTLLGTGNVNLGIATTDITSQDATFNGIELLSGVTTNGGCYYSDFYIVKGTDRLGTDVTPFGVQIDPIFTISDSAPIGWTPTGSGSHWDQINANPPNNDTTYVKTAVSGTIDSYNWQTIPTFSGTVRSVFLKLLVHSNAEGLCQVKGNVGAGGTQAKTDPFALCDIDLYHYYSFDVDPLTGLPWLATAFNTRPFGIELV